MGLVQWAGAIILRYIWDWDSYSLLCFVFWGVCQHATGRDDGAGRLFAMRRCGKPSQPHCIVAGEVKKKKRGVLHLADTYPRVDLLVDTEDDDDNHK